MKLFIARNKQLLTLIVLGLIAAFAVLGVRFGAEQQNRTYDIVLDYAELAAMAEQSEHSVEWWLETFRDKTGITKVGLIEENIQSLMENPEIPVTGRLLSQVTRDAEWKSRYPAALTEMIEQKGTDPFDVLVETGDAAATDFVLEAVARRIDPRRFSAVREGDRGYVLLDGTADTTLYTEKHKLMNSRNGGFIEKIDPAGSKLMYISLGLLPERVRIIQDAGMEIVPRTLSYNGWNGVRFAEAVMAEYEKYGISPTYMIVGGEAIPGYDDGTEVIGRYLREKDVKLGLIENTTQLQNILQYGVQDVIRENNYQAVRVFSVWNYIQNRYQYYGYPGAEEIENTLFRAVTERNIRVIYFKPVLYFKDLHTYVTDEAVYETLFTNLKERLDRHGLTFGEASELPNIHVNRFFQGLLILGCVMAGVLLLDSFWPVSRLAKAILAGLVAAGAWLALGFRPDLALLMLSFASAVIFACLAVTFYVWKSREFSETLPKDTSLKRILLLAAATLAGSVILALLGGVMTAAPLSSVNFMLEIDIFRGVKLAQLLPICYFAVAYMACFGFGGSKQEAGRLEIPDIRELLNTGIKVWMILLAGALGAVGAYYIMRTGHDSSIQVSGAEMLFRNKLEDMLLARPRTKEFLIAFPAVMLTVYAAVRRLRLFTVLFGLAGVLGMTSVVNTFMHLRTPLLLGFVRTGYSLLFGLAIGCAGILVFDILYRLCRKKAENYLKKAGAPVEQR